MIRQLQQQNHLLQEKLSEASRKSLATSQQASVERTSLSQSAALPVKKKDKEEKSKEEKPKKKEKKKDKKDN